MKNPEREAERWLAHAEDEFLVIKLVSAKIKV